MEEIKSWGLLMLFVSAGSLIYCFLLPSGAVSRAAKSVISIVLVCTLLSPVLKIYEAFSGAQFSFSEPPATSDYGSVIEDSAKAEIEKIISDCVRQFTSVPYETEIFINIGEDYGINIEYVRLIFSATPQFEENITKTIYERLGIFPDIRVELTGE